jgi:hypothetical protein
MAMRNWLSMGIKVRDGGKDGAALQGAEVYVALRGVEDEVVWSRRFQTNAEGKAEFTFTRRLRQDSYFTLRVRKPGYWEFWLEGGCPWRNLGTVGADQNWSCFLPTGNETNPRADIVLVAGAVPQPAAPFAFDVDPQGPDAQTGMLPYNGHSLDQPALPVGDYA